MMTESKNLCPKCMRSGTCFEPFPHDECERYERRLTNKEIISLFRGMRKSMQVAVYKIMMEVQEDGQ